MVLPKLTYTETIELPSGKRVRVRPFSVGDEKVMLVSREGSREDFLRSIGEVVGRCVVSPEGYDPFSAPATDVLFAFAVVRSISAGEALVVRHVCDCGAETMVSLNVRDFDFSKFSETKEVSLTDEVSVEFSFPTFNDLVSVADMDGEESFIILLFRCLRKVVNGDEVIDASSISEDEWKEWVETLPAVMFDKMSSVLVEWLSPSFDQRVKCSKCGKESTIRPGGGVDFFTV